MKYQENIVIQRNNLSFYFRFQLKTIFNKHLATINQTKILLAIAGACYQCCSTKKIILFIVFILKLQKTCQQNRIKVNKSNFFELLAFPLNISLKEKNFPATNFVLLINVMKISVFFFVCVVGQ